MKNFQHLKKLLVTIISLKESQKIMQLHKELLSSSFYKFLIVCKIEVNGLQGVYTIIIIIKVFCILVKQTELKVD
jgi:hypothetical protein